MFGMGKKKPEPAKASAPAAKPEAAAAPVAPGVATAMPGASTIKRGPMNGMMQDWKLTVDKVIEPAYLNHGQQEIVSGEIVVRL